MERLVDDIATVPLAQERQLDLDLRQTEADDLVAAAVASVARAFDDSGVELLRLFTPTFRPSWRIRTVCRRCWPTCSTTPCGTPKPEAG